jgi:ribose 5-phosphate isomerase B
MKIGIVSDHRGYKLKGILINYLKKKNFEVLDFGTDSNKSVDYPKYGFLLGEKVSSGDVDFGIAICGSGIGISIACNKVKGIRCAKVDTPIEARHTRLDNDANILALCGSMPSYKAKDIIDEFFKTSFSNEERHLRRINQIKKYELGDGVE